MTSSNVKEAFYSTLKSNLVAELANGNLSMEKEMLESFILFLSASLDRALDRTFADLKPIL